MKNILKYLIHSSLITLIYLFILGFVTDNHKLLITIMQLVIFVLVFAYKKYFSLSLLLSSIFVFLILLISGMVFEKDFSRGGLYVFFLPLIFYLTKKLPSKLLLVLIPIIIFNGFVIFPNYFEAVKSFNYPKSLGTDIEELNLVNSDSVPITIENKGLVVLDFWTTSCGACFKKFPEFEKLSKKYSNRSDVVFYVINIPIKRDKNLNEIVKRIDSLGYSFKKLYAVNRIETEKLLDIHLYPKILIIKNGKIINTKQKINSPQVLINNLEYKLNQLLD